MQILEKALLFPESEIARAQNRPRRMTTNAQRISMPVAILTTMYTSMIDEHFELLQQQYVHGMHGSQINLHDELSGPISGDIAVLSLRYLYRAILFQGGSQLHKMMRCPPLLLSFTQGSVRYPILQHIAQ